MNPQEVFRTDAEGYFFENEQEAFEQSVNDAGENLFRLLREDGKEYSKQGAGLLLVEADIKIAIKNLFKAFKQQSFTKYKISK